MLLDCPCKPTRACTSNVEIILQPSYAWFSGKAGSCFQCVQLLWSAYARTMGLISDLIVILKFSGWLSVKVWNSFTHVWDSTFFCIHCWLQDRNPMKYSIGEPIIEQMHFFSGLDGASIATMCKNRRCLCTCVSPFYGQLTWKPQYIALSPDSFAVLSFQSWRLLSHGYILNVLFCVHTVIQSSLESTLICTSCSPPPTTGPAAYPITSESSTKPCKYEHADTLTYCKQ